MKFMFAADLHGSAFFCRKLMEIFERENPEKLILLGDILYHGPRNNLSKDYNTMATVDMLNAIKDKIICIRGNCDSEVDQMVLEFPMSDYSTMYLNNKLVFLTHGHIYNKRNLPPINQNDIMIHGHTHVQTVENINGIIYLNPGSISLPKNNNPNSFMLYENDIFNIKDLNDNIINSYKMDARTNL